MTASRRDKCPMGGRSAKAADSDVTMVTHADATYQPSSYLVIFYLESCRKCTLRVENSPSVQRRNHKTAFD
jgi:hypothetical protein